MTVPPFSAGDVLSRMRTGLCLGIDFVHVWSAYTFLCENLLIGYIYTCSLL